MAGRSSKSSYSSSGTASQRIYIPPDLLTSLKKMNSLDYLNFVKNSELGFEGNRSIQILCFKIIHLATFEYFMSTVILINMLVMIIETDRDAKDDQDSSARTHWTHISGWSVLGIFTVELVMRLFAYRCQFWRDAWNCFDFIVVVLDIIFSIIGLVAGNFFQVSILRIFRLGKLARAFKIFRVFPELRLLLAGVMSCMSAIVWGTVLLFFFLLVWALVAVLVIHPLNKDIPYGDDCERCSRAYSSVLSATLTFWTQIVTGDSWGQVSIPVIEKHPSTVLFFIPLYLTIGMSVTNLILGVVVNVAQRSQDKLQEEDSAEQALIKLEKHTHLLKIMRDMDSDDDGNLSAEEVKMAMQRPGEFRETVLALDISDEDFEIVWTILDAEQKGYVSYKELVNRISTMKQSDTTFMLSYIKYYIVQVRDALLTTMQDQRHHNDKEISQMQLKVEEDVSMIVAKESNVNAKMSSVEGIIGQDMPVTHERSSQCDPQSSNAASMRVIRHEAMSQQEHDHDIGDISEIEIQIKEHMSMMTDMKRNIDAEIYRMEHVIEHDMSEIQESNCELATQASFANTPRMAISPTTPQHFHPGHDVTSALSHDISQKLLEQVRFDISFLQVELKDMLKDMDGKLRALVYPVAASKGSPLSL